MEAVINTAARAEHLHRPAGMEASFHLSDRDENQPSPLDVGVHSCFNINTFDNDDKSLLCIFLHSPRGGRLGYQVLM